jgi:hypothetical protein
VPAREELDEPLLLRRRGLGQLEHVTVELEPHGPDRPWAPGQPAPHGGEHRPQRLGRGPQADDQPADDGDVERPRAGWSHAIRERADVVDVQLVEVAPQMSGQQVDALGVGAVLRDEKTQFAVHGSPLVIATRSTVHPTRPFGQRLQGCARKERGNGPAIRRIT